MSKNKEIHNSQMGLKCPDRSESNPITKFDEYTVKMKIEIGPTLVEIVYILLHMDSAVNSG